MFTGSLDIGSSLNNQFQPPKDGDQWWQQAAKKEDKWMKSWGEL
jgi:hypothetical protein